MSRFFAFCVVAFLISVHGFAASTNAALVLAAKRIVFLGDSITYSGEYVDFVETYLRLAHPEANLEIINLGLPSETVSGLSEPGHAGGAFPRPDLHERLSRVLAKTKPDLIFASYGMNDGIYFPFSEERFAAFQKGIVRLREQAAAAGAKIVHLTPSSFDPVPLKGKTLPAGLPEYPNPFEGYNGVLDRYSQWLLDQRPRGWAVIDAHFPMNEFLAERRKSKPGFSLARDGVHINAQGHWLIAREILEWLGAPAALVSAETPEALFKFAPRASEVHHLVQKRSALLKDAWLTDTGHLRPGMNRGKPLPDAQKQAAELGAQIRKITQR